MAVRTVEAYGRYLSRAGTKDDALKVYQDFSKAVPGHPVIVEEMKEITAGEKLPVLADSPQAGAAEALYGLGASIGRRGGEDLALIYLQLALYLEPTHTMALLSQLGRPGSSGGSVQRHRRAAAGSERGSRARIGDEVGQRGSAAASAARFGFGARLARRRWVTRGERWLARVSPSCRSEHEAKPQSTA
jgi:hypothetical protein